MTPKNYFNYLSVEVIEQILLNTARPSDLLSLALTERRMSTIIIPSFLEYSQLKFHYDRCDVWEHLNNTTYPRVKHLELWTRLWGNVEDTYHIWQKSELISNVPRLVKTEEHSLSRKPGINEICGALIKMSNMKKVVFNNHPDLSNISRSDSPRKLSALALAIYNSGCKLEDIDLYLRFSTEWTVIKPKLAILKMLSDADWLSSIKTCRLSLFPQPSDHPPEFQYHLMKALFLMVNLTHLKLVTTRSERLWHDGMLYSWPKLEYLCLKDWSPTRPVVVQQFDAELFTSLHPRLHTLYLENTTFVWLPSHVKDEIMAPALKSFGYKPNIHAEYPVPPKNLPLSIFKNLSHLTLRLTEQVDLDIFDELDSLESCIVFDFLSSTLNAVEIAASISHGCVNLRKLRFYSPALKDIPSNNAVLSLFRGLRYLTHLFGTIQSRNGQFPNSETDALMKRLYEFPSLCYIDFYLENMEPDPTFVELKKDDTLRKMSYEILVPEPDFTPKSCDHLEWGGFGLSV